MLFSVGAAIFIPFGEIAASAALALIFMAVKTQTIKAHYKQRAFVNLLSLDDYALTWQELSKLLASPLEAKHLGSNWQPKLRGRVPLQLVG